LRADHPGVLRSLRHHPFLLALLAAAATLPGAIMERFAAHPVTIGAGGHFVLVVAGGVVAAAASVALTVVGVQRGDGRSVLLGCAFSTMTALLAVHGLATPGVLVGPNGVVALAGGASLPVGAVLLALSAHPRLREPRRIRAILALQGSLAIGVIALGAVALLHPELVPVVPEKRSPEAAALLGVGTAFFLLLACRAIRTVALTHRRSDFAVAVGCVWLAVALFPQLMMMPGTVAFYLGHVLEIVGVALIGVPAALDLIRGGSSRPLVGDLSATEIVAAEEAFLGARVGALVARLARKDPSTEQHTRRVALLAVQVGEELRLPPAMLRHLAVGGLLHDIGKLAVPSAILQKPGRLDDDEFAAIKRHPEAGVSLLRELGGFSVEVRALVGQHHERLDGAGYPSGLAGAEIAIGPRILAVCDVYDALVSDRVYRDAWTPERALALLRQDAGTAFDGDCVYALTRVLGKAAPAPRALRPAAA
jgi:putative nucleotidyltransferase with HDIG domain